MGEVDHAVRNARLLAELQALVHVGIWEWNIVSNALIWDETMYRLYGIQKESFAGAYEAWSQSLAPEDLERATRELQAAVEQGGRFDTSFRIVRPDGSPRYIRAYGVLQHDDQGRPVHMIGTNWDITDQRVAEEELRQQGEIRTHDGSALEDEPIRRHEDRQARQDPHGNALRDRIQTKHTDARLLELGFERAHDVVLERIEKPTKWSGFEVASHHELVREEAGIANEREQPSHDEACSDPVDEAQHATADRYSIPGEILRQQG